MKGRSHTFPATDELPLAFPVVRGPASGGRLANTHSVDLGSVDLAADARLMIDGAEHAPVEDGPLSGHHSRATLVFELPGPPASFAILIQDVPDSPLRIGSWRSKARDSTGS